MEGEFMKWSTPRFQLETTVLIKFNQYEIERKNNIP